MIHDERERLVERFAAGRMTPAEKSDLQMRAAGDERLARLLQAEQTITTAVERDRAGFILAEYLEPSARVLGSLAASSIPSVGGPLGGLFAGSAMLKGIVGVVGLLGLTAGLYFFTPIFDAESRTAEHTSNRNESVAVGPGESTSSPTSSTITPGATTPHAATTLEGRNTTSVAIVEGMTSVVSGGSSGISLLGRVAQRLEPTREMGVSERSSHQPSKIERLKATRSRDDRSSVRAATTSTAPQHRNTGRREFKDSNVKADIKDGTKRR